MDALKQLALIEDDAELAQSVAELCRPFGPIKSIRVIQNGNYIGERWCYITVDSPELHKVIEQELGGTTFEGSVALYVRAYK